MVGIRILASAAGVLSALWGLYLGFFVANNPPFNVVGGITSSQPSPGGFEIELVSVILLVSSLVNLVGFKLSFYFSAAIAAILIARVYFSYQASSIGPLSLVVIFVLCVATIVLDVMAARRKVTVSEENHPLNLPVFG